MLGVATGCRSQLGLAALALTRPEGAAQGLARVMGGPRSRSGYVVGAAGELIVDQRPTTPSRLDPPGLISRIALGGFGGALLAQRHQRSVAAAVLVGAGAAAAASYGGSKFREAASKRFSKDYPGALIEDIVAIKLAWLAVRGG
jgi:uncharacterized membrane protein